MGDYSWIPAVVGGVAKAANSYGSGEAANSEIQKAYEKMLANLQARFTDYDNLGKAGYKDIAAQQVGPSALEGLTADPQTRMDEQQSLAALQQLADNGGLSLADMKALNDIQANLNRNTLARRQGLANDFAARGQLGSGAQLAMDLSAQQQAATSANQQGESAAAQAQARALQAILQKGQLSRQFGNDDWQRKADAAKAHDMIEARNAAARTDAAKANNAIAGQSFNDELAKAQGKTNLTNSMNSAVFGSGTANANTIKGRASAINGDIDNGVAAWGKFGGGSTGSGTGGNTQVDDTGDGNADEDAALNEGDDD